MIKAQFRTNASGRRSYPLAYKIEFLAAWDECVEHGEKARLLREHGLHSTTVGPWLKDRAAGKFEESLVGAALSEWSVPAKVATAIKRRVRICL